MDDNDVRVLREAIEITAVVLSGVSDLQDKIRILTDRRQMVALYMVGFVTEDVVNLRSLLKTALDTEEAFRLDREQRKEGAAEPVADGSHGLQKLVGAVEAFLKQANYTPPWHEAGAIWAGMLRELNIALTDAKEGK